MNRCESKTEFLSTRIEEQLTGVSDPIAKPYEIEIIQGEYGNV